MLNLKRTNITELPEVSERGISVVPSWIYDIADSAAFECSLRLDAHPCAHSVASLFFSRGNYCAHLSAVFNLVFQRRLQH